MFDWLKKNKKYDLIHLCYIPEFTSNIDLKSGLIYKKKLSVNKDIRNNFLKELNKKNTEGKMI